MAARKITDDELRDAMRETRGNGSRAARILGVTHVCVLFRCRKLGIALTGKGGVLVHDLTGRQFGRLKVLRLSRRPGGHWLCRCLACGRLHRGSSGNLRHRLRSCGRRGCRQLPGHTLKRKGSIPAYTGRRRTDDILASLHAGETMQQIADRLGVSRQRVHQLVAKARIHGRG